LILFWGGWMVHSLWFIILSKNGWMRHNWYALILAVFLLAIVTAHPWQQLKLSFKWGNLVAALFVTTIILFGFAEQTQAAALFITDNLVNHWYRQHLATNHTRIPWSLVPRQAQQEAVDFIAQLPPAAHIFYPEGHKSAEMAVLTGRVLYPIERRKAMPPAKGSVILIGPSLISPWRKPTEASISPADRQAFIDEVLQQIKRECPQILLKNDYYIICALN